MRKNFKRTLAVLCAAALATLSVAVAGNLLDGIKNRPMEYDDRIVRQLLECVVVDSKEQITVIFKGGVKVVEKIGY